MPTSIPVNLPARPYNVIVGHGILDSAGERIGELNFRGGHCAVVTDTNVAPLYAQPLLDCLEKRGFSPHPVTVPAGEESKSIAVVEDVCRQMINAGLDRNSFLVALGGGVVGDLAGFVAAVFHRGIPWIQIPTTVVAQVDSAVGGKTGVNAPEGKNLIGAFHQPSLVLADTNTLQSLPDREYREGFAEIIKHAAIRDAEMIPLIEPARTSRDDLAPLIERNVRIKAAIVVEDEKETSGARALLNFGHTVGHAIEASAGYGALLHGEAVSLGIRAALEISQHVAGLSTSDAGRIASLLDAFDLPAKLPATIPTADILQHLERDKKFQEGRIRFVVLNQLGSATVSDAVTLPQIEEAIQHLR